MTTETGEALARHASHMDDVSVKVKSRLELVERLLRQQLQGRSLNPSELTDAELVAMADLLADVREDVQEEMVQAAYDLKVSQSQANG